jgi:hypothetical protein
MTRPTPPSYLLRLWREHGGAALLAFLTVRTDPASPVHEQMSAPNERDFIIHMVA